MGTGSSPSAIISAISGRRGCVGDWLAGSFLGLFNTRSFCVTRARPATFATREGTTRYLRAGRDLVLKQILSVESSVWLADEVSPFLNDVQGGRSCKH